jgi:hypothetical protein
MLSYNRRGNRRIRQNVRPVVWEDGGREAPSYPIAFQIPWASSIATVATDTPEAES